MYAATYLGMTMVLAFVAAENVAQPPVMWAAIVSAGLALCACIYNALNGK